MAENKDLVASVGTLVPQKDAYIEQLKEQSNKLENGGYYKNVRSPEEYIAQDHWEDSRKESTDLDLTDDKELQPSKTEEKLDPKKFWSQHIIDEFESATDEQKKAWLNSFKIVEKNYAKRVASLENDIKISQRLLKVLEPARAGIEKQGYSLPDYVETLVNFDNVVSTDPAKAIARLWASSGLTYEQVYNAVQEQGKEAAAMKHVAPYLEPLQQEVAKLKEKLGGANEIPSDEAGALDKAKEVYQLLTDFYSQRDNTGKEMYPNAMERFEELVEELETGCTLQDAYERVMGREPEQASDEVTMEDTAPRSSKRRKTPQEEEEEMLNRKLRQILRS